MLSIKDAFQILNKKERKYTLKQAAGILDFLYPLAEIAYKEFKLKQAKEKNV